MAPLTLNKPVVFTLEPQEIAVVLDALAERPYKQVAPVVETIMAQARAAAAVGAPTVDVASTE